LNKYELIKLLNETFDLKIKNNIYEEFYCDKTLNITKFKELGFNLKPMNKMIIDISKDSL